MHCKYSRWSPKYTEFVCTAPGIDGNQICTCSELLDFQEDIDIIDNVLIDYKINFEQEDPEKYNERITAIDTR